jgi:hypothetical protein
MIERSIELITSFDKDYKATKRVKLGSATLSPPLNELAEWISKKWSVTVINVIYDSANKDLHAPRLQVILEHRSEVELFRHGNNFDETKQHAIASRFVNIVSRDPSHGYDLEALFVVFSAFAPLARQEAANNISEEEIDALQRRIGDPDVWVISRCFDTVTFMFYTDAQAKNYAGTGKKEKYAHEYFKILKPFDEFNYLDEAAFEVQFDSKENFDKNYESNWFYYYR